jgi:hypothetical protein
MAEKDVKIMFMVEQMKPKEKLAQFNQKRGWFWHLVLFLTTPPQQENHNELNGKR